MASRIRRYVPQPHTFPCIALSMSASVGFGLLASNAAADMICPAWQYPHCGTSTSNHAFCNGCDPSADKPSIVVTAALADTASELRSFHVENVSENPEKGHVSRCVYRLRLPVHSQFVGHIINLL